MVSSLRTADRLALERAREIGAELTEWRLLARFVSADPKDAESWERMGILDHRSGLCEQAVFEFEQASAYTQLSAGGLISIWGMPGGTSAISGSHRTARSPTRYN